MADLCAAWQAQDIGDWVHRIAHLFGVVVDTAGEHDLRNVLPSQVPAATSSGLPSALVIALNLWGLVPAMGFLRAPRGNLRLCLFSRLSGWPVSLLGQSFQKIQPDFRQ